MAPHLTLLELDKLRKWGSDGFTPIQMHARLKSFRDRRSVVAPNLTNIRKVLKGNACRRSKAETRGRKKALSKVMVRRLSTTRKMLVKDWRSPDTERYPGIAFESPHRPPRENLGSMPFV